MGTIFPQSECAGYGGSPDKAANEKAFKDALKLSLEQASYSTDDAANTAKAARVESYILGCEPTRRRLQQSMEQELLIEFDATLQLLKGLEMELISLLQNVALSGFVTELAADYGVKEWVSAPVRSWSSEGERTCLCIMFIFICRGS
jgi:hypothetical protein